MRIGNLLILALFFCMTVLAFAPASGDYTDKETWFLGLEFGYWTIDPFLDQVYEDRGSISGSPIGLQGGYAWELNDTANVEVVGQMTYWLINMTDADYLTHGAEPEDMTSIKTDGNVNMFTMGCMARFPLKVHPIVQPIFGIGLGLGFLSGNIEKQDHGVETGPGGADIIFAEEWEDYDKPSIIPIVDILTGFVFHIPDNVKIYIIGRL